MKCSLATEFAMDSLSSKENIIDHCDHALEPTCSWRTFSQVLKSDSHGEHRIFYTLAKYVIYNTLYTYLLVKVTKTLIIRRNPGKKHTFLKAKLPHSVPASSVAVTSEVMIHSANIGTV